MLINVKGIVSFKFVTKPKQFAICFRIHISTIRGKY